jgi:hypothetical protein
VRLLLVRLLLGSQFLIFSLQNLCPPRKSACIKLINVIAQCQAHKRVELEFPAVPALLYFATMFFKKVGETSLNETTGFFYNCRVHFNALFLTLHLWEPE